MEDAAGMEGSGNVDGGSSMLSTASSKRGGSKNQSPKNKTTSLSGGNGVKIFGNDDQRVVFGEFDVFCRRLIKLEDLFSTIKQFQPLLASKQLEMRELVNEFKAIVNY
jgi:hypothetical protein